MLWSSGDAGGRGIFGGDSIGGKEVAARLRDEISDLKKELRQMRAAH